MALYVDENEYPQNYDWLPQEKQQAIIDMMQENSESRANLFKLARSKTRVAEKYRDFAERQWSKRCDRENAMLDILEVLGIKVEYDWVGHRGTYFLATYDDALAQQDYYDDIARDAEGDVDEYRFGGDYDSEEIDY
jgi:hypothetical protein